MNMIASATRAFERLPLPDAVTALGITYLVDRTRRSLTHTAPDRDAIFLSEMVNRPIAEHTDAANDQHYEIPPEFFGLILGPRRKYSCCLYDNSTDSLAMAEDRALAKTALHAGLADGQDILELGCGWGSLSLWMAEHYPAAYITSVSNSHGQRKYIEAEAAVFEASRLLAAKGAQIIAHPSAEDDETPWLALKQAIGFQCQVFLLTGTTSRDITPKGSDWRGGASTLIGPDGKVIASMGGRDEGHAIGTIDLAAIGTAKAKNAARTTPAWALYRQLYREGSD